MSIHIWTGVSGTGKTEAMFKDIKRKTDDNPLGSKIYILTPTQNTLSYEYILTEDMGEEGYKGSLRTSVLSFSRLMWHIFNEIGHNENNMLNDTGHIMLLHKIMQDIGHDALTYYKDSREFVKFSGKVLEMIEEFVNYDVSIEDLNQLDFTNTRTTDKYNDLKKIYQLWQDTIDEYNIENINLMPHFIDILNTIEPHEVSSLNNATFYIDGFHNFTEVEFQLIKTLNKFTDDITLLLMHTGENKQLFRKTNNVIDRLQKPDLFGENGTIIHHFKDENLRTTKQGLKDIEAYLRKGTGIYNNDGMTLIEAPNMRDEILEIMRQIETLVRQETVTYNDIGVLYRDQSYVDILKYYFEKFGINYSIDEKYRMCHHPFIQFIMSVFEAYRQNFKRESIINIMKSGYLNDSADYNAMYLFETVLLEAGLDFQKALFNDDLFINYLMIRDDGKKEKLTECETERIEDMLDYKNRILNALSALFNSFNEGRSAKDYIESLYLFLEENGVLTRIEKEIESLEDNKYRQNETEEAYNHFIELLDNAYIVYSHENIPFNVFMDTLMEGLKEAEFSLLPATLDEVTVGKVDLAKVENKKYVFMIGMNHTAMPSEMNGTTILTDDEKRVFQTHNIDLSPTNEVLRQDERFVFYHGVTRPTEHLFISYAKSTLSNEPTKMSPFVKDILDHAEQPFEVINPSYYNTTHVTDSISSIHSMEDILLLRLREMLYTKQGEQETLLNSPKDNVYLEVLNALKNSEAYHDLYNYIVRVLTYTNRSEKLDEETAQALYGKTLNASVSRFQSFYNCQFKHFMEYGLSLNPREEFKLESLEIGNLYHMVLEDVMKYKFKNKLRNRTDEEIHVAVKQAVNTAVKNISHGIFEHSNYYQSLMKRATETIEEVVINLRRYLNASQFEINQIESTFGYPNSQFKGYKLETKKHNQVNLQGKIDRVDTYTTNEQTYVSLIDYKSSPRGIDLKDVYLGLELQQFTYMNVIEENGQDILGENLLPLTMMFYPVISSEVGLNSEDSIKARLSETKADYVEYLEKAKKDRLRPSGLIILDVPDETLGEQDMEDPSLVALLNQDVKVSDYYTGFSKKGKIDKRSLDRFITLDMYDRFKEYAIHKIKEGTDMLYEGHVTVNPVLKNRQLLSCRFCEFKSACNIDYLMNQSDFVDSDRIEIEEAVDEIKGGRV